MKKKKLRALLKILVLAASVLLLIVFFKSLFPAGNNKKYELVEMGLKGIQLGEIRKIRFDGKEVGILKRKDTRFKERVFDNVKHQLPDQSLDKNSRSQLPEYFVYYNVGDSGNCPLFHNDKGFKDICSQKVFDETGREQKAEIQGYAIKIPPHTFKTSEGKETTLLIGKW